MSDDSTKIVPVTQNSNGSELARKLHTSMLVVLIFFFYALLAVSSTTDMMFLRKGEIALPIIQASVPVVGFYLIAPLVLVLLHLHLLARLVLYAKEIYDSNGSEETLSKNNGSKRTFREALSQLVRVSITLFSFEKKGLITEMKNDNRMRSIVRIIFTVIFVLIPLTVLLIIQARFLSYQSDLITLFHQSLITFYVVFQSIFIYKLYRPMGKKLTYVPLIITNLISVTHVKRVIYVSLVGLILFVFPLLFVWTVALVPDSTIEKIIKFDLQQSIAGCFFPDWWKKYGNKNDLYQCDFLGGERFINIQNEIITLRDPHPEIVGATIQMKNSSSPKIHCEHVGELDLSERRFIFANFTDSKFHCVNMSHTKLKNSTLVGADLHAVNLTRADLRGANLRAANLSTANLTYANLSTANLTYAKLMHADLSWADLSDANLSGANLFEADIKNADLSGVVLWGADLKFAHVVGSNLNRADLRGADLGGAELYGSRLYEAQLGGAKFEGVKFEGAKLEGAKLYSANFSGSTPRGISLDKADGKRPKEWDNVLYNIKRGLKEAGDRESEIDARMAKIKQNAASALGYVSPTGTDHCNWSTIRPEWNLRAECVEAETPG